MKNGKSSAHKTRAKKSTTYSKTHRLIHFALGYVFLIGAAFLLANSISGITGNAIIEEIDVEQSSVGGGVLLLGAAVMFRLGLRNVTKGQAAMEFMMTYGWTILIVTLVLGVLGYFIFFNPAALSPDSAIIGEPFYIIAGSVDTDSVNLAIRNDGDQGYIISELAVIGCGVRTQDFTLPLGKIAEVSILCDNELTAGESFSGDITIRYRPQRGTTDLTVGGVISTDIQAGIGILYSPKADDDGDGLLNEEDNCPLNPIINPQDSDGDGIGDVCDNCDYAQNQDQSDQDGDGIGDACDPQTCGNNLKEDIEVCDGTDLGGLSCELLPEGCTPQDAGEPGGMEMLAVGPPQTDCYAEGTLLCFNDCSGYDESQCIAA